MIGPGGLLLVVPKYLQFPIQFYWWGCQKKGKLRHLILLSRVTDILSTRGDALTQDEWCILTLYSDPKDTDHVFLAFLRVLVGINNFDTWIDTQYVPDAIQVS
jgi:hypothetical protein